MACWPTPFSEQKSQYSQINSTFWVITLQPTGLDSSRTHFCFFILFNDNEDHLMYPRSCVSPSLPSSLLCFFSHSMFLRMASRYVSDFPGWPIAERTPSLLINYNRNTFLSRTAVLVFRQSALFQNNPDPPVRLLKMDLMDLEYNRITLCINCQMY
jgi:hypothetical protein